MKNLVLVKPKKGKQNLKFLYTLSLLLTIEQLKITEKLFGTFQELLKKTIFLMD